MKRLALYGAGRKSIEVERIVRALNKNVEMKYLIENKVFDKIGTKVKSLDENKMLDVISVEYFVRLYHNNEIDGIIIPSGYHLFDINEICQIMDKHGITEENIYSVPYNTVMASKETITNKYGGLMKLSELRQLYHLDIHLLDHCNLKCKACSHFSPLVKREVMVSVEDYRHNIKRLHQLMPNIVDLALLGGEPLLHPNLKELIHITREYYPFARIVLVTNGILLEQMPLSLMETIQRCNILISISLYPPMYHKIDDFLVYLKKNHLLYKITKIEQFERKLFQKPCMDGFKMTQYCGHLMCLRGNRIGRCITALFADYYNEAFDEKLPSDRGICIDDDITGLELLERLNRPLELCNQCCARDHYYEEWDYAGENPKPTDWFLSLPRIER